MYIHPKFAIGDEEALDIAARVGFGQLTVCDGGVPVAAHLPFLFTSREPGNARVAFHVARNNAIATLADGERSFLLAATGPDTYLSPDWYASHDQVSTWLYEAVHLTGTVRQLPTDDYLPHVDALSAVFEHRLLPKKPWTSDKMPPERRAMLLKGIICMEMAITRIEGVRKLNQIKNDADHIAIVTALDLTGDMKAHAIADMMRDLRPDLDYAGEKE